MRPLIAVLIAWGSVAHADPTHVLRFASVVPDGTGWSREMRALSRDVARATNDDVALKWYFGAIAGDDIEAGRRIARGQLDGVGAGAWQCERWAPSIAVTRLPGLFRNRSESRYIAGRLRSIIEDEFQRAGMIYLGDSVIGPSMIFLRRPLRSMEELRQVRLWTLDNDATKTRALGALGLTLVPLPFEKSRAAYDEGHVDGFLAPPSGALAFQWSTQGHYLLDLTTDYVIGCLAISQRAFDSLSIEHQRAVRAAAAKFLLRFDDAGAHIDSELLGGLFARQGLTVLRVDDRFRGDFQRASEAAWKKLEPSISAAQISQVQAWLAEYRAHH